MSEADEDLPRAHGAPVLHARMRSVPEDFCVEELPAFEPAGAGEHLLLTIEKRGMNTAFVARHIAQWAGVPESAVGYAGLKDRHAVTRQRFSVQLPGRDAPGVETLEIAGGVRGESLRVLDQHRHARKLPRGALAGNRFVIRLRGVEGEFAGMEGRLRTIAAHGVPNYFGEQRFGRAGDNVARALEMFAGRRVRREQRSVLLSAARSALFNRVLAARVAAGDWDSGLDGEVWMLDGSRSVFGPEPLDAGLRRRLESFDIHPTGPLWGRGELRSQAAAREVECAALAGETATALRLGVEAAGLRQERRALRLRPAGLEWSRHGRDTLEIRFELPPGSYATAILAELGTVTDAAGG